MLDALQEQIIPFIRAADEDAALKHTGKGLVVPGDGSRTVLVEHHAPKELESKLELEIPEEFQGKDELMRLIKTILKYSVNTWDQGFMDKLYASTNAVCTPPEQ